MTRQHFGGLTGIALLLALGSTPARAHPGAVEIEGPIGLLHAPAERPSTLEIDQFELRAEGATLGIGWDGAAHFSAIDQGFRIESAGESELGGDLDAAEVAVLWARPGRALSLVAGVRHEVRPTAATHVVIGVRDIEVWGFDVEGSAFLSTRGQVSGRIEVERDVALFGRFIAQPSLQLDIAASKATPTRSELGMRLFYAGQSAARPYIGVEYERSSTRASGFESDSALADEPRSALSFLVGIAFRR